MVKLDYCIPFDCYVGWYQGNEWMNITGHFVLFCFVLFWLLLLFLAHSWMVSSKWMNEYNRSFCLFFLFYSGFYYLHSFIFPILMSSSCVAASLPSTMDHQFRFILLLPFFLKHTIQFKGQYNMAGLQHNFYSYVNVRLLHQHLAKLYLVSQQFS